MNGALPFWTFSEPKPGADPGQNEDRFAVAQFGPMLIASASDGASGALFSGQWAERIVGSVTPEWFRIDDDQVIRRVGGLAEDFDPMADVSDPDFVLEDKWAEHGSAATLASVLVDPPHVRALAVGDSIIGLHTSTGAAFFPIDATEAFGRHPRLIESRPTSGLEIERWAFDVSPGDVITLSTDAVGAHLVGQRPTADRVRQLVEELDDGTNLRDVLTSRAGIELGGSLDDDLTIVVIEIPDQRRGTRPRSILDLVRRWLGLSRS